VRLSERDGGTRIEIRSTYQSREEMDKLIEMGMLEGLQASVGQMDALLPAGTSP
jgi:Fe2+ transport system protein FeoA